MLYVDKTAYLHRLVTSPDGKCFFLARPRRFGKSLMITTLKEIFNGRKDLFEGLAIAKTDFEWKKHPVLHFNFGFAAAATSYEQFESMLNDEIERALGEVGCEFDPRRAPGSNFARAIDALAAKAMRGEGELPVILVDEYIIPIGFRALRSLTSKALSRTAPSRSGSIARRSPRFSMFISIDARPVFDQ